jgi:hypothetical protein
MAHTVKFEIPRRELGRANVEFLVYKDGQVFGKLLVSKGAIVWRKKWKSTRGRKMGWGEFHRLMQENGRSVRGG